ncbi:hypothetical protein LTR85_002848 [Meristemomyces frigidus]|nr:hypothetical protein LTR85_002848 [Meristemomyces frigidus]
MASPPRSQAVRRGRTGGPEEAAQVPFARRVSPASQSVQSGLRQDRPSIDQRSASQWSQAGSRGGMRGGARGGMQGQPSQHHAPAPTRAPPQVPPQAPPLVNARGRPTGPSRFARRCESGHVVPQAPKRAAGGEVQPAEHKKLRIEANPPSRFAFQQPMASPAGTSERHLSEETSQGTASHSPPATARITQVGSAAHADNVGQAETADIGIAMTSTSVHMADEGQVSQNSPPPVTDMSSKLELQLTPPADSPMMDNAKSANEAADGSGQAEPMLETPYIGGLDDWAPQFEGEESPNDPPKATEDADSLSASDKGGSSDDESDDGELSLLLGAAAGDSDDDFMQSNPHIDHKMTQHMKVNKAAANKCDLAMTVVRLEEAKDAKDDIFANLLLEVIEVFREADAKRDDVKKDENLSDPTAINLPFQQAPYLHPMALKDWLRLEPRYDDCIDKSDTAHPSWIEENMLANMVLLKTQGLEEDGYFCDPATVFSWLSSDFSVTERVRRLQQCIKSVETTGQMPANDRSLPNYFPVPNLKTEHNFVVIPVNTGAHWIVVKMQPDKKSGKGAITVHDSLGADIVLDKARRMMKLFAELVCLRPGLAWNQSSWTVESAGSPVQRNATDCGPFAANTSSRLMQRLEPLKVRRNDAVSMGDALRWEALSEMSKLLTDKPLVPSAPQSKGSAQGQMTGKAAKPGNLSGQPHQPAKSATSSAKGKMDGASKPHHPKKAVKSTPKGKADSEAAEAINTSSKVTPAVESIECGFSEDDSELSEEDDIVGLATSRLQSALTQVNIREVLCNALWKRGEQCLDELLEEIGPHVPVEMASRTDLAELLMVVLERTDFMFDSVWHGETRLWHIIPGRGRSVDTVTKERLSGVGTRHWATETAVVRQARFDAVVSIVRTSGLSKYESNKKDIERCRELMEAYWSIFVKDQEMPDEHIVGDPTPEGPFWSSFYREARSSREGVFSGPAKLVRPIRTLLQDVNDAAKLNGRPRRLLLLANGFDGLHTDNSAWDDIRRCWPYLDISICLAIPAGNTPGGLFHKCGSMDWAHYSLTVLALLWRQGYVGRLGTDERICAHHEQLLYICQVINALKLDFTLRRPHPGLAFRPLRDNAIAKYMTRYKRNRHALQGPAPSDKRESQKAGSKGARGHSTSRVEFKVAVWDPHAVVPDVPGHPSALWKGHWKCVDPECKSKFDYREEILAHAKQEHGLKDRNAQMLIRARNPHRANHVKGRADPAHPANYREFYKKFATYTDGEFDNAVAAYINREKAQVDADSG